MELTFVPNGNVQIDNARITFRNFEGRPGPYNRMGERSFSIIIPDEDIKDALLNDVNEAGVGWNVKIKPPRDEQDTAFMHLKVKVNFNARGPYVCLISGDSKIELNEETVKCLDEIDIDHVDLDIRPYDNEVQGTQYRTAYLSAIRVFQRTNRFID